MPPFDTLLWLVIITALLFDFINGWNDAANAIATVVGTRVLSPLKAVAWAAVFNMIGAFMGQEVAKTVAGKIVDPVLVSQTVLIAAMGGAIIWAACMTLIGMPISGSHSLLGGFLGAAVAKAGIQIVVTKGVLTIIIAMLVSPILGFIVSWALYMTVAKLFHNRPPGPSSRLFAKLQLASVTGMSLMHGANDAQKVMGIITLALVLGSHHPSIHDPIPVWVVIACGSMISFGTLIGGWKVIRTLGHGLSKLKPVDGFTAETAATGILYVVKNMGVPVSTTHTITGCILGVGATKGVGSVRWGLGQKIVLAWVFTLPLTMAIAGGLYWILWAAFELDHNPEPPWKASVAVTADGKNRIQWPEIEDADSYQVFRYDRIDEQAEAEMKKLIEEKKRKGYVLRTEGTEEIAGEEIIGTSFVDKDAKPGHRYVYRIRAVNKYGPSKFSDEFVGLAGQKAPSDDPPKLE